MQHRPTMIRVASLFALRLVGAGPALAFDPAASPRYASPDMYRPNVDDVLVRGGRAGATVDRLLSRRLIDMGRNVRDFGAVCDGATDNGPAFQRAFASGARVVRYDLEGCASHYLVNTTVTIPGGSSLVGPGDGTAYPLGIRTSAAVDTFVIEGGQWAILNTRIQHDGTSGMAINGGASSYGTISHNAILGNAAGNTSPLVRTVGSLVTADQNSFTTNRVNAYSYVIDGPGVTAPIVHRMLNNNFGGTGKGISIGSTSGKARPEGIYITSNHCFLKNTCLLVTSVNDLKSSNNTWDIGGEIQVGLLGSGQGIDLASFEGDYLSTFDTTHTPTARPKGVCMLVSGPVSRLTVRSKFAYCGTGISSTDGSSSKITIGSVFLNVARVALELRDVKGAMLTGNTCTSCFYNFKLADGLSGGPYILNDNQWDASGKVELSQTNPANFRFGLGNTGINLSGYSAATTGSMALGLTCVSIKIPHGLSGAPNLDKTVISARVASGAMSAVSASPASVDATNITAQVCGTVSVIGTVRVTANASL
ncbi:hypothetical protein [Methylobacterium radiotolerans]|uniref:hypothetical protein n=1 Tax=Methylobacterium radiotolerans TaxID=31998 RepID=UPI000D5D4CD6|nr:MULTISPECIES: hypothetical protein [Methylobacterium]MDE3750331.1 hypothetical protein [Methylobacterium radiotolerans]PVY83123.1 hypothetical protein C7388_1692 [Methylobacterium organophilum]